jgi:hypothetical protein
MRAEGAMTLGMVAGLAGAAGAAWIGAPSVLVALVAAIGLGWGAVRAGVLLARAGAPTPSRGQLRAVGLALLVVSTGIATPAMSSTTEAQTVEGYLGFTEEVRQCNPFKAAADDFFQGGIIKQAESLYDGRVCTEQYYDLQALAQEEAQAEADLHAGAASRGQARDAYLTGLDNTLQDSETVAWSKAEIAIAEAYENGKNESQAAAEAKAAIRDYYAVRQKNLEQSWDADLQTVDYIRNVSSNDSDIDGSFSLSPDSGGFPEATRGIATTGTLTLVNGSTIETPRIEIDRDNSGGTGWTNDGIQDTNADWTLSYSGGNDTTVVVPQDRYKSAWTQIETQSSGLTAEVDPYVTSVYDGLENGTINSSDVISKAAYVGELGTDYQNATTSGQGNVYNSIGALGALGLDVPELNGTGTITVEYTANGSTQTADGLLAARAAPSGSWESNTTYNASQISGPVYLAKTDGEIVSLDGEFTVSEIRDRDGNSIQNVTAERVAYQTTNASELQAKLDSLEEYRAQIEARSPLSGIGGIGLGNTNPVVILVAAALALFLIGRSSNG